MAIDIVDHFAGKALGAPLEDAMVNGLRVNEQMRIASKRTLQYRSEVQVVVVRPLHNHASLLRQGFSLSRCDDNLHLETLTK